MDFNSESKGFLINLVAKLLQIDSKELNEQLNELETAEDIETTLSNVAADRIKHIRKNAKDMAYGRAKREEREAAEKLIKAKLGIESSGTLDELLDSYTTKASEEKPSKKSNLTLDDMLKSEEMKTHIGKFRKQIEELSKSLETEKADRAKDKFNFGFDSKLRNILKAMDADLGEKEQASTRFDMYKMYLSSKHQFDNEYNPIDQNGDRVFSENGYDPMSLEDLIKNTWTFGFKEANKPQSQKRTPNPNENSFNTPKFGLSKDDLKDGQLLYQKLQEAKKADNKEAVEYYQKQLIESAK